MQIHLIRFSDNADVAKTGTRCPTRSAFDVTPLGRWPLLAATLAGSGRAARRLPYPTGTRGLVLRGGMEWWPPQGGGGKGKKISTLFPLGNGSHVLRTGRRLLRSQARQRQV